MARPPDWFERLDAIVDSARQTPVEVSRPAGNEGAFCLQRTRQHSPAPQIRRHRDRRRPFPAPRLSRLPNWRRFNPERPTRPSSASASRWRKHLAVAQAENVARRRRIPGSAQFQAGKSLADLPAGVRLEPGRIVCEFAYPEDFWAMIDTLADIAAQDPEAFEQRHARRGPGMRSFAVQIPAIRRTARPAVEHRPAERTTRSADLPLAPIAAQYLAYIQEAEALDVNLGMEWIDMAARLIHWKSSFPAPGRSSLCPIPGLPSPGSSARN